MELGIFGVGDRHPDPITGQTSTEHERAVGLDRGGDPDLGLDSEMAA
jgi:hypothetical protein